jgi:hypothetical protein
LRDIYGNKVAPNSQSIKHQTQRTLLDWPGSKKLKRLHAEKLKPEGGKQRQKLKSGKLKAEMGN